MRRLRRRFEQGRCTVSPGTALLYLIVLGYVVFGVAQPLQGGQSDTRESALAGCKRQNTQTEALLDLGTIITEARNLTSTSKKVRNAAPRFLLRVKRMRPSLTTYALRDLATILGGDTGKPKDPEAIIRAEDDFIEKSKKIEKPRDCEALYG